MKTRLPDKKKPDKFARDFAGTLYEIIDSEMNGFVDQYTRTRRASAAAGGGR